ncbi:uncharacterized protein [Rutidosis leptorrhynchoides]|uniref:uncharacterized protein n=1 Tax=Rutidosis leptorrhynchoides TaxID=125765 RepID=UPI003A9A6459
MGLDKLLQSNMDIFTLEYRDMTGIPRTLNIQGKEMITEHRLNEYKHLEPVHQKKRNLASERDKAACEEVEELLKAGIIREAKYPTWVANPVMVKKSDGGWRIQGETLYVYLAASKESISAVLITERARSQIPIYFVSRTLQGAEVNYPELEKLTLALVHTARKLRRYFQAHPIVVLTNKPIRQVPEKSGRMAKWAVELGEHDIEFKARNTIKGQVLAAFISETTEEEEMPSTQIIIPPIEHEEWKLFTDGASSSDGSGAGFMLVSPEGKEFTYALHFEFSTTNNEAEYEALLAGLRLEKDLNIQYLMVFVDSQLVVNQVAGTFEARSPTIQQYLAKLKELIEQFKGFEIEHVRRSQNKKADALSKLSSITFANFAKEVLVKTLERGSIEAEEICDLYPDEKETWMKPIKDYLAYRLLLKDKGEARKIRIKAPSYKLQDGKLYQKSFLTSWLRCVGPSQATIIIQEMHEGVCGFHAGPRSS